MSNPNLPNHYQDAFTNRWVDRIQREMSLLANTVSIDSVNGYRKKLDQLEKQAMRKVAARHAQTQQDQFDTFIRWLYTSKYELSNIIDEWDDVELGELIAPTGRLTVNHTFAYNRAKDQTIVDGVEGVAYTGENGATLISVPSTQIVQDTFTKAGTSVQSGLIFDKVARAKRIFRGNALMTGREVCAVIGPDDEEDLIVDVNEIRNRDFSAVAPIDKGGLHEEFWMGFNWIVGDDDLLTTASNVTNCLFYHKRHIWFGDGQRRANIDILPNQSHAIQVRSRCRMGCTRDEEKGAVIVETYHA